MVSNFPGREVCDLDHDFVQVWLHFELFLELGRESCSYDLRFTEVKKVRVYRRTCII